jgi:hypothetical protein
VPGQQGCRCDEPMVTQRAREQPSQSGQDRSVWPSQVRSGHLTAQDVRTSWRRMKISTFLAAVLRE